MSVLTPVITSISPISGVATNNPQLTNASVLTLTGTVAPNTNVQGFTQSGLFRTATVGADGVWSLTSPVSNGWYQFTAVDKDSSGATSAPSAMQALGVDQHVPTTPTITSISPDTGAVGDGMTTAQVLTLTGTADP